MAWSAMRGSNPHQRLGRPLCYRLHQSRDGDGADSDESVVRAKLTGCPGPEG